VFRPLLFGNEVTATGTGQGTDARTAPAADQSAKKHPSAGSRRNIYRLAVSPIEISAFVTYGPSRAISVATCVYNRLCSSGSRRGRCRDHHAEA
jgi:hypothetical protein